MTDDREDGSPGTDDLDSTIDQLESLLDSQQELLLEKHDDLRPPPGAKIPRLTDKIGDATGLKFDSSQSDLDETHAPESMPADPTLYMEAPLNDVKQTIGENVQQAFAELKADVVAEIKREVIESIVQLD